MSKDSNLKWKCPIAETPPIYKELLVKSPDGVYYIASYRKAYHIFTCQLKSETFEGWKYFVIEELNQNQENARNMLTVKEVLDILDDSDHLDDAKNLIRETIS